MHAGVSCIARRASTGSASLGGRPQAITKAEDITAREVHRGSAKAAVCGSQRAVQMHCKSDVGMARCLPCGYLDASIPRQLRNIGSSLGPKVIADVDRSKILRDTNKALKTPELIRHAEAVCLVAICRGRRVAAAIRSNARLSPTTFTNTSALFCVNVPNGYGRRCPTCSLYRKGAVCGRAYVVRDRIERLPSSRIRRSSAG